MSTEQWSLLAASIQALGAIATFFRIDVYAISRVRGKKKVMAKSTRREKTMLVLAIGSLVACIVGLATRPDVDREWSHPRPASSYPMQTTTGATFHNETVPLDGHKYVNCTFHEVTFTYEGRAPFSFDGNTKIEGLHFRSDNARIGAIINLMSKAGMLNADVEFR
jgi:hypothetical protein